MVQKKKKRQKKRLQIRQPMEMKEIEEGGIFWSTARGTKTPEREIKIYYDNAIVAEITTNLNESHRDILDTIMALAYRDHTAAIYEYRHKAEAYYACKWSDLYKRFGRNTKWILKHIEDIGKIPITLYAEKNGKRGMRVMRMISEYGFISTQKSYSNPIKEEIREIAEANKKKQGTKPNPSQFTPEEGDIFYIALSHNWVALMDLARVMIGYSIELLDKLRKKGKSLGAMIKFIISQEDYYRINDITLLKKMRPDWDELSPRRRRYILSILKKKIDTFKEFGIDYDLGKHLFSYNKHCEGVSFFAPISKNREQAIKAIEQYKKENDQSLSLTEELELQDSRVTGG